MKTEIYIDRHFIPILGMDVFFLSFIRRKNHDRKTFLHKY